MIKQLLYTALYHISTPSKMPSVNDIRLATTDVVARRDIERLTEENSRRKKFDFFFP